MKQSLVVIVLAACGGAPKPAPAPAAHGEMEGATPELAHFHDTLAPRWHAAKRPARMTATCGAIAEFTAGADAIAKGAPAAKADAGRWKQESTELTEAVAALKVTCEGKQTDPFETAFANVHHEFHELLELATGEHEGSQHEGDEH